MNDNNNAGDFDDHEPGDVNGNVDPAFLRKQKQQARGANPNRAPSEPGAVRPPRAPREPRAPRPPRDPNAVPLDPNAPPVDANTAPIDPNAAPRGPSRNRTPRGPRGPRVPRPVANGADVVIGDGASAVSTESNTALAPPPAASFAQDANFDAQSTNNSDNNAAPNDGSAPTENAPAAGYFDRGPRRNRRGGRNRNRNDRNDRVDRNDPNAPRRSSNIDGAPMSADATSSTPEFDVDGTPLPFDAVQADESQNNEYVRPTPNAGAFGNPELPMDRGARQKNRSRNRREGLAADRVRERSRAPGALVATGDLPPDGTLPISGVNEAGERDGERLHKVLAQQGLGSRRNMEALIEAGEVEVNGQRAHVGQVVNEKDRVHVKRRKVSIRLGDDNPSILIYHKNAGEIVSRDDPEQRDTVFDRLPRPDHGKWVAIGRLDYNSEGLMLFTTSGELANRLMHPSYQVMREYSVRVLGELTPEQEDQLVDGIELDDGPARLLSLDRIDRDSDSANHWYKVSLQEGRNREVRRMFEFMGLTVSRLIRTTYGIVSMPSWLKRGQYKQIDETDVFNILESVGMRSRKKLEKAARFGGARGKLPPAGPLGPMRSANEHEAIYNGLPASPAGGGNGARDQRRGRNGGGGNRGGGYGSYDAQPPAALQQQQFPGFGGATEMAANTSFNGRGNRGGRGGPGGAGRVRRGPGGEVDGNVMPGYGANAGNSGRRGPPRGGARPGGPNPNPNAAGAAGNPNGGRGGMRRGGNGGGGRGPRPFGGRVQGGEAAPFDPNATPGAMSAGVGVDGNTMPAHPDGGESRNPRRGGRRRRGNGGGRPPRGEGGAPVEGGASAPSTPSTGSGESE
jgi:pseudouridine synthase